MQRTTNQSCVLQKKYQTLYSVYDTLLHIFNRKYFGIFQEANADELLMGYKSIETVFSVTSAAGASTSYSVAEKRLKKRANKDELYYATYLKPYSMVYETDCGIANHLVRMRDCFVILMIDNLVRLKHKDDPDRGDNRCKQLCLLPVTVQGLPIDSAVTTSWHDADICDGTDNCPCKQHQILKKSDLEGVALHLSLEESQAMCKFEKLSTFGNGKIFTKLFQNGKQLLLYCNHTRHEILFRQFRF